MGQRKLLKMVKERIKELEDKITEINSELYNNYLSEIEIRYLKVKRNSLSVSLRRFKKKI